MITTMQAIENAIKTKNREIIKSAYAAITGENPPNKWATKDLIKRLKDIGQQATMIAAAAPHAIEPRDVVREDIEIHKKFIKSIEDIDKAVSVPISEYHHKLASMQTHPSHQLEQTGECGRCKACGASYLGEKISDELKARCVKVESGPGLCFACGGKPREPKCIYCGVVKEVKNKILSKVIELNQIKEKKRGRQGVILELAKLKEKQVLIHHYRDKPDCKVTVVAVPNTQGEGGRYRYHKNRKIYSDLRDIMYEDSKLNWNVLLFFKLRAYYPHAKRNKVSLPEQPKET